MRVKKGTALSNRQGKHPKRHILKIGKAASAKKESPKEELVKLAPAYISLIASGLAVLGYQEIPDFINAAFDLSSFHKWVIAILGSALLALWVPSRIRRFLRDRAGYSQWVINLMILALIAIWFHSLNRLFEPPLAQEEVPRNKQFIIKGNIQGVEKEAYPLVAHLTLNAVPEDWSKENYTLDSVIMFQVPLSIIDNAQVFHVTLWDNARQTILGHVDQLLDLESREDREVEITLGPEITAWPAAAEDNFLPDLLPGSQPIAGEPNSADSARIAPLDSATNALLDSAGGNVSGGGVGGSTMPSLPLKYPLVGVDPLELRALRVYAGNGNALFEGDMLDVDNQRMVLWLTSENSGDTLLLVPQNPRLNRERRILPECDKDTCSATSQAPIKFGPYDDNAFGKGREVDTESVGELADNYRNGNNAFVAHFGRDLFVDVLEGEGYDHQQEVTIGIYFKNGQGQEPLSTPRYITPRLKDGGVLYFRGPKNTYGYKLSIDDIEREERGERTWLVAYTIEKRLLD